MKINDFLFVKFHLKLSKMNQRIVSCEAKCYFEVMIQLKMAGHSSCCRLRLRVKYL